MKYSELNIGDWFSLFPGGEVYMKTCHPDRGLYNLSLAGKSLGTFTNISLPDCADEQKVIFTTSFYVTNPRDFSADLIPKDRDLTLFNAPIGYYYYSPNMDCFYWKTIFNGYEECAVSINGSNAGYWGRVSPLSAPIVYPRNYFTLTYPEGVKK